MSSNMFKLILLCALLICGDRACCYETTNKLNDVEIHKRAVVQKSPGFILDTYGESYYYIDPAQQGNFFQALHFCIYNNMSLLSIESEEETDFLYDLLLQRHLVDDYFFWTSGTTLPGNKWVWLSTGQPIFNTNWFPGQPDNHGNHEKCLEMTLSFRHQSVKWNDNNCDKRNYVICEVGLTKDLSNLVNSIANCNLTHIKAAPGGL